MKNGITFDSDVRKGLVFIAIQETLMRISRNDYERVVTRLKTKYNCYIPDCYLHPEYLKDILEGLYGESSGQIINQIKKRLEKFSNQSRVNAFLTKLSGKEPTAHQDLKILKINI